MSNRSQLTKDLNESVKQVLGKHVKILLKNVVRLETKSDKTELRVLVFSSCRFFLLTAKVPTRIDCHYHYLDIVAIESKRGNHLSIHVANAEQQLSRTLCLITGDDSTSSQDVDNMITALLQAIKSIFHNVPLQYIIRKIDIIPNNRLDSILEWNDGVSRSNSPILKATSGAPCGNFSGQYACMCDYHGLPYREEVSWDVDSIYLAHDTKELCLKDFDHLDQKDLIPIISALEYNQWFQSLRVNVSQCCEGGAPSTVIGPIKLNVDVADRIIHVMKKSLTIEQLYLDNLGLKCDYINRLSMAMMSNQACALHTLDLSYNQMEDKGAVHLSGVLARAPKGFIKLVLSHCQLTAKGVNQLAHALSLNKAMFTSLTYLDLSGNYLKDDINNLYNYLAQPNSLTHLDLSSTDTILENLFGALLRGCATNLERLNLSRNVFSQKKNQKEVVPSFKQFFTSALHLKYIYLSHCKLPLEALKNLLLGLACNESSSDIHLDIGNNQIGNSNGAHCIESCIHGVRSLSSLDISENNLDVELSGVIQAISKNRSIKHLYLNKSFVNMKTKHVQYCMEQLVLLLQDDLTNIKSLHLNDNKLKQEVNSLINALATNQSLEFIDISGNQMGDTAARLLAKALQINRRLNNIQLDRNNITLQGFIEIAYSLQENFIMKYMPMPINDITQCYKVNGERTDQIWRQIQHALNRNLSPTSNQFNSNSVLQLQQGYMLLNSTQQTLDRLVIQLQETVKSLTADATAASLCLNNNFNDCASFEITSIMLAQANALLQDADNSKTLLLQLHDTIVKSNDNQFNNQLNLVADQFYTSINQYLQNSFEKMLCCAMEQCPTILGNDRFLNELKSICLKKLQSSKLNLLSKQFIQQTILDHSANQIIQRVNETNCSIASCLSERISDQVIEQLTQLQTQLLTATSTPNTTSNTATPPASLSPFQLSSLDSHQSFYSSILQSPIATPHMSIKRKSCNGLRKMRPKSVVDTGHRDSRNNSSEEHSLNSNSFTSSHSVEESLDSVTELSQVDTLQHLVKTRPKRTKVHAPKRPIQLNNNDKVDGLDIFFSRPSSVTPTTETPTVISPTSEECSSLSPHLTTHTDPKASNLLQNNNCSSGDITPILNEGEQQGIEQDKSVAKWKSSDNIEMEKSKFNQIEGLYKLGSSKSHSNAVKTQNNNTNTANSVGSSGGLKPRPLSMPQKFISTEDPSASLDNNKPTTQEGNGGQHPIN